MDEIRCAIEVREVEGNSGSPSRYPHAFLIQAGKASAREMFERGSLSWYAGGMVLNRSTLAGRAPFSGSPRSRSRGATDTRTRRSPIPLRPATRPSLPRSIRSGLFKGPINRISRAVQVKPEVVGRAAKYQQAFNRARVLSIGEATHRRLSPYESGRASGGFGCDRTRPQSTPTARSARVLRRSSHIADHGERNRGE